MSISKSIVRWFIVALGVAAVTAVIYVALQPKPIPVDVAEVTRGAMMVTVDEDGQTRIKERYVVSAPLSGRLLRVELDPGDQVVQDSTRLAAIAPRDPELLDARELNRAEAQVKANEAALAKANPSVKRAQAALLYAQSDIERMRQLVPKRAVSQDQVDRARRELRVCEEDYRAAVYAERIAKFELELARAALIRTKSEDDDFSDFEIFSPIHGVVLRVLQESATVVDPGTPLIEVGDPLDLEVIVDVLSSDAVKIDSGDPVLLERWGGEQTLQGKVRRVEPSAFTKISALGVEEQRVYVVIDLVDPVEKRGTLGDGFRVEARIVIWEQDDVMLVPGGALFRIGDDWAAFVLQDSRAELRRLTLGQANDAAAEVLEGLSPGETVILHPSDKIQDATQVVVRAAK